MPDNDDNTSSTPGRPFRVVDPTSTEGAPDLNTDADPTGTDPLESSTTAAVEARQLDRPDWPRWANTALNQLDTGARRVVRFVDTDPEGAFRLLLSTIVSVVVGVLAISVAAETLRWAVEGQPLQDLAGILPARELVTVPLQHWLTVHTAGTGIDVDTAAWTWGITGAVVWVFACCNQLGAQLVAWPAYGAATIAMAWFGTATTTQRPVVAGVVAIAWTVLSLFALNRRPAPRPRRYVINRDEEAA